MDVQLHSVLSSALVGYEWSASRPSRFTPNTYWIRSWMGPRVGPDAVAKRKHPYPFW